MIWPRAGSERSLVRTAAAPPRRRDGELIGDIDGPAAVVSPAGTVEPLGAQWGLRWAVGTGDRWHIASDEAAVRSRIVDGMPVVATAMRVRGGDVVQRAAAVSDPSGRAVVVEFVNETPTAVSLAVSVLGFVERAAVRGSRLVVGDRIAAELDRIPGGAVAVADGEVWDAVRAGPEAGDCEASSGGGRVGAAALVPLTPRTPLRVVVPIEGEPAGRGSPEDVASGWRAVVGRAASVELPDEAASRAWDRGVAAAILAAGGLEPEDAARSAVVLDQVGLVEEADRARAAVAHAYQQSSLSPVAAPVALRALASRRLRSGRVSGLAEWAGPLVDAAGDHLDAFTLEQVAAALEPEAPAAARDARRLLAEIASRSSVSAPATSGDGLGAALRHSAEFGGDGLVGLEALLDCLVAEAADHIVMAAGLPAAWRGASVDALSLVTRHGTLSFSVRWHGSRPALLWDLAPPMLGARSPVALRCGLDPSWSTSELAGEALLGPVA